MDTLDQDDADDLNDIRYFRWRHSIHLSYWDFDRHWYVLVGWLYLSDLAANCTCCPCPLPHPPCPRHDLRAESSWWTHLDEQRLWPNGRKHGGPCPIAEWQEPGWWERVDGEWRMTERGKRETASGPYAVWNAAHRALVEQPTLMHVSVDEGGALSMAVKVEEQDPRVDWEEEGRPGVLGGECARCLHRPPLHEPGCVMLECRLPAACACWQCRLRYAR